MTDLYPSRCSAEPAVLPRLDPVAWQEWHPDAPLSRERYERWSEDGFLVLDDVFSPAEVAVFQNELRALRARTDLAGRPECIAEPRTCEMRSLFAPQHHSALYRTLMRDARILEIARFLLADEVYVHQSRVNFKPGFQGREFFWHSDFETWHTEDGLPRMRTLSVSIALSDNTVFNGPLMLIPGSHREYIACVGETPDGHFRRSLQRQEAGLPDADNIARLARNGIHSVTGKAGTVTIFDCNTLHGSAGNMSPWPRSNLFFVYNSVSNRPQAPFAASGPRPWYISERERFEALESLRPDYLTEFGPVPAAAARKAA